jgi:hypothetical protein
MGPFWVANQPGHTPVAAKTRSFSSAVNGLRPRSTFSKAARLIPSRIVN